VHHLEARNEELQRALDGFAAEMDESLQSLEVVSVEKECEVEAFHAHLAKAQEENERLRAEVQDLTRSNKSLSEGIALVEGALEEVSSRGKQRASAMAEELRGACGSSMEAIGDLGALISSLSDAMKQHKELEQNHAEVHSSVEELVDVVDELKRMNDELRLENDTLSADRMRAELLEDRCADLEQQLAAAKEASEFAPDEQDLGFRGSWRRSSRTESLGGQQARSFSQDGRRNMVQDPASGTRSWSNPANDTIEEETEQENGKEEDEAWEGDGPTLRTVYHNHGRFEVSEDGRSEQLSHTAMRNLLPPLAPRESQRRPSGPTAKVQGEEDHATADRGGSVPGSPRERSLQGGRSAGLSPRLADPQFNVLLRSGGAAVEKGLPKIKTSLSGHEQISEEATDKETTSLPETGSPTSMVGSSAGASDSGSLNDTEHQVAKKKHGVFHKMWNKSLKAFKPAHKPRQ